MGLHTESCNYFCGNQFSGVCGRPSFVLDSPQEGMAGISCMCLWGISLWNGSGILYFGKYSVYAGEFCYVGGGVLLAAVFLSEESVFATVNHLYENDFNCGRHFFICD